VAVAALIRFVVLLLAIYRVTRLVVEDEILDEPRNWVFDRIKADGNLSYLLTCYWCTSFWVAIPLTILYIVYPPGMMVVGLPLAGSAVTGLIDQKVR